MKMDEKIAFTPTPNSFTWETFLATMTLDNPEHFENIDNTAQNGRQAIKRYYRKMRQGRLPYRLFSTKTSKANHSFTVTREK